MSDYTSTTETDITTTEELIDSNSEDETETETLDETVAEENFEDDDTITELYNIEKSKEVIVSNNDRITLPKLSKYERTRLLGERTRQITEGAKVMVKTNRKVSAYELALLELNNRVLPIKIIRKRPDNKIEIWKINELN